MVTFFCLQYCHLNEFFFLNIYKNNYIVTSTNILKIEGL